MRIICPKCELNGQVDVVPKGAKPRIACVRCATTFDAVFVDGEIRALQSQASQPATTLEIAENEVHDVDDVLAGGAESVFTPEAQHENEFDDSLEVEESPVLVDDFSASSSSDLRLEATAEKAQDAPREISHELAAQVVETDAKEATNDVQDFVVAAQPLKANGANKVNRPPSDAYGMGVRLMQVSPAWLLLAGLSFISFIVFCNWLIKPTETGDAAGLVATANNRATNQAPNRVVVPASTAQSTVNRQVGQSSSESGVAFIATEAKVETPPVAAPSVAPVEAKQVIEEKPASSANRAHETKEGKVTIQIGSFNAASEAEARVANLQSAGFEARSVEVEIPKRGTWYRVQSGRFVSRDEAERYGKQLRDKGIVSSFITTDVQE